MADSSRVFGFLMIGVTLVSTILGQLSIKQGMNLISAAAQPGQGTMQTLIQAVLSPWVIAGLGLAGVGAFAWMLALSKMPLSYAYPFLSVSFPLVVIAAAYTFGETVSVRTYIGLAIIVGGLIVASSASPDTNSNESAQAGQEAR